MPTRSLPAFPNLDHLKAQAKDLRREHAARSMMAAQRLREFHPRFRALADEAIFAAELSQSDALLAIAREYGYSSWPKLKAHVEGPAPVDRWSKPQQEWIADPVFRRAVDLIDAGDATGLRELLLERPGLVTQRVAFEGGNYFREPSLLEFVAENPVRNGRLPGNIVEVARVVIEAGTDRESLDETLMLVATGSVTRECGVQRGLIDLLCGYGADADSAAKAAAVLREPDAVAALVSHGARVTPVVAAALDVALPDLRGVAAEELQIALSVAAQFGRAEMVRELLRAGAEANRYNPPGGHAHATPLHQAACYGCVEAARALVEGGARLDIRDVLWGATPLEWARHEGKMEVAELLEGFEGPRV